MKLVLVKSLSRLILKICLSLFELFLQFVMFIMPFGLYKFLLQVEKKPQAASGVPAFTEAGLSTMLTLPSGDIIVCIDGKQYKRTFDKVSKWWKANFNFIFMLIRFTAYISVIFSSIMYLMVK